MLWAILFFANSLDEAEALNLFPITFATLLSEISLIVIPNCLRSVISIAFIYISMILQRLSYQHNCCLHLYDELLPSGMLLYVLIRIR